MSRYGISRFRAGYRTLTLALGAAGLASAGIVLVGFPRGGRLLIAVVLVIVALCRAAISWVPMDAPGAPRSPRGSAHGVLAIAAFVGAAVAANRMLRAIAGEAEAPEAYVLTLRIAFWLIVAAFLAMLATRRVPGDRRFFGVPERGIYAGMFLLFGGTAFAFL